MPTYLFKCPRCGARCSDLASTADVDSLEVFCEDCGTRMTRVYDIAGVIFKGSGFYSKDNRD